MSESCCIIGPAGPAPFAWPPMHSIVSTLAGFEQSVAYLPFVDANWSLAARRHRPAANDQLARTPPIALSHRRDRLLLRWLASIGPDLRKTCFHVQICQPRRQRTWITRLCTCFASGAYCTRLKFLFQNSNGLTAIRFLVRQAKGATTVMLTFIIAAWLQASAATLYIWPAVLFHYWSNSIDFV